MVAAAIAAFRHNNRALEDKGLAHLKKITFPAIIMEGTNPKFYKIPVSEELQLAVYQGSYPAETTLVERLVPVLPNPRQQDHGLLPLDNRKYLLQGHEGLRRFLM